MFRLMGHVLPDDKSIWIGLTTIYGIGRVRSQKILKTVGIDHMTKVRDLTEDDQKKISDELKNFVLESDLKREVASAIKRLKEIKCYRGMRHNLGLPVRGQLTRKNARTAKKLLGRSKVRPVLKK
ncbi:MAG: 30S ribosomal protein S13 [Candidatus Absconditabacteria bacterium]|nr:30S ribosomal protein S13 [Candidatus Absconditabacteria bacterium]MDD3868538.1 30S ribosomal protein S13 [Candidatus Absconditabacteria bacterium]MDD4714102.1 30S ribosomal protein S13 [Candidatus Absconditabacteria bacterium]